MNNLTKYAITTGALALALSADAIPSAAANPEKMQTNSAITSRTNSPHLAWAVVRVSISDRGDVEAMRIAYQSGDKPFDKFALQAVSKTTFASISSPTKASSFNYYLSADANGKRSTRIIAPLRGDATLAPEATVAVRETNPWTSPDAGSCDM